MGGYASRRPNWYVYIHMVFKLIHTKPIWMEFLYHDLA
jgi:hypothetical protein